MQSVDDHAHDVQCDHPKISDVASGGLLVRDVMLTRPKTMPATATVADLRQAFANPHVLSALLVDGSAFAGVVNRDAVPVDAPDDAAAVGFARVDVQTVGPESRVSDAVTMLDSADERRLVVLADDGVTLAGLVCLDQSRTGFCQSTSARA